jgi:transcriptional regulator with XRE-family HTH domain
MEHKRFSDQIREAVDASELSRYRICQEINLSQAAMSRFMAGRAGLSLEVLDRLAELLGLEVIKRSGAETEG